MFILYWNTCVVEQTSECDIRENKHDIKEISASERVQASPKYKRTSASEENSSDSKEKVNRKASWNGAKYRNIRVTEHSNKHYWI